MSAPGLAPQPDQTTGRPKAILYLRVSDLSQVNTDFTEDGLSLAAQRDDCLRKAELVEPGGADVVEEFVERGESGRSANRTELKRMLQYLKDHPDIAYVIVHKLDRLARVVEDAVVIRIAIKKAGATLVSATENIDDTPHGRLVTNIMTDVASFYSDNLAAEALKGMRQKAKLGGTPGLAPIGYLNVIKHFDGKEVRTVDVDLERSPHVVWAWERFAEGDMTIELMTEALDARGLRTKGTKKHPSKALSKSRVHKMLTSTYYLGVVTFSGVEYPGRHEPLISSELFYKVQDILQARRKWGERPQRRTHYLKGSLACGLCKRQLSIGYSTGHGGVYPYFFCLGRHRDKSCRLPYLSFDAIEEMVEDFWEQVVIEPEQLDGIRADVTKHLQQVTKHHEAERVRQQRRLTKLDAEGKKLMQAYLADAIELSMLRDEQARVARERNDARVILEAVASEYALLVESLDEALGKLDNASALYLAGTEAVRRELNHGLFKRLYVVPDGIAGADLNTPFAHLLTDDLGERLAVEAANADSDITEPTQVIIPSAPGPMSLLGAPRAHRIERPRGPLPAETENLASEMEPGSNISVLVGEGGFEPPTLTTQTSCAAGLRYSPGYRAAYRRSRTCTSGRVTSVRSTRSRRAFRATSRRTRTAPSASEAATARSSRVRARSGRPSMRLESTEVMRDRSPVGAAAAEAIEHDVPVAVRLEQADARARPRSRSPSVAAVSASTAIANNQFESAGSTKSRASQHVRTRRVLRRGRPACVQHSASTARYVGMCGFSSAAACRRSSISAGPALEEPDVDEVDAERGDGFGVFRRRLVLRALRTRAPRHRRGDRRRSRRVPRQLVVAHDQYGCASWSASARACSIASSTPARSPSSRRSSTSPSVRGEPPLRRDLPGGSASASRPSATRADRARRSHRARCAALADATARPSVSFPRRASRTQRCASASRSSFASVSTSASASSARTAHDAGRRRRRRRRAVERVAQERGAFGVGEIDGDAAAATANERQRRLRSRASAPMVRVRVRAPISSVDRLSRALPERALRASEPDEGVGSVRRRRSRDRPPSRTGRGRPTRRPAPAPTRPASRSARVASRAELGPAAR